MYKVVNHGSYTGRSYETAVQDTRLRRADSVAPRMLSLIKSRVGAFD